MYHNFVADKPNTSGSLRNAQGRKDTLSKKNRCSIFIHIIFRPFVMNSGFNFNMIALLNMKWRSKALAFCAIAMILLAQGIGLLI